MNRENFFHKIKKYSFVLPLFFLANIITAQKDFIHPNRFDEQQGYELRRLSSVAKDKEGFLWLGGFGGLLRFDGSSFQKIPVTKDSSGLQSEMVMRLYFDSIKNEMWIAQMGGGLSRMDLVTQTFQHYTHNPDAPSKLPTQNVYWVMHDRLGDLWAGLGDHGIAKYIPEQDSFQIFQYERHPTDEKSMLLSHAKTTMEYAEDIQNDSILWLGTISGLLKFNKFTHQFKRYVCPHRPLLVNDINSIREILPHPNGKIYLGTWGGGISIFDPKTETFDVANLQMGKYNEPDTKKVIDKLWLKNEDIIYVTTGGGLIEYSISMNRPVRILKTSINRDKIFDVTYIDPHGKIFAGSISKRLHIFNPINTQVDLYISPFSFPGVARQVRGIWEDTTTQQIYVATLNGKGLNHFNPKTKMWQTYPLEDEATYFKKRKGLRAINVLKLSTGELIVLDVNKIYQFDASRKILKPYRLQVDFELPDFRSILEDRKGNIWLGMHKKGLVKINPKTNQIQVFKNELDVEGVENHGTAIWDLEEDRNGNIWIRATKGVSVYVAQKDTFINLPYLLPDSKKRIHVSKFGLDLTGRVWIGMEQELLGITNPDAPEKGIVEFLDDFLPQGMKELGALIADDQGDMWYLGDGMREVDWKTKKPNNFAHEYGFYGRVLTAKKLTSGAIVMGVGDHIGFFHPDSLKTNQEIPKPYLTSFKIFDEEIQTPIPLHNTREIFLQPHDNFFSIEFSSICYNIPHKQQYAYQLEGVDPDWVNPGSRRYVAYTNVAPGTYIFKVKAANNEGLWNESPTEVRIHIAAPWHKTTWAYLLYISTLGIVFYFIYKIRKRRQELQFKLKLEQQEAERLKELDSFKSKLYTNITHEFRTPLTVIKGVTKEIEGNDRKKILISKNANNLLGLINQLLDLSKLESGEMTLDRKQTDMISFLKYLTESYQSFAFSQKINLSFFADLEKLEMDFDLEKFQQIISNLISNAIKFTPQYGKILLFGKQDFQKNQFILKISDSGVGIPSEKLPHIFDRFYQADSTSTRAGEGTGIGLALVKELVELHGGNIQVQSELKKGTTFTLLIPITQQAPKMDFRTGDFEQVAPTFFEKNISEKMDNLDDQPSNENADTPNLLLIEDNADVIQYLILILKNRFQILVANNGKEGIEKALLEIPDLIISDVMMPEKDGFEVCETLKKDTRTSHIPIILLTAKLLQRQNCRTSIWCRRLFDETF